VVQSWRQHSSSLWSSCLGGGEVGGAQRLAEKGEQQDNVYPSEEERLLLLLYLE